MTDQQSGQLSGKVEGEHAAGCNNPVAVVKNPRGRPKGSKSKPDDRPADIKALEQVQRVQKKVISRQQKDCRQLAGAIDLAHAAGQAVEAKDVNALARATSTLHELERKAHNFGQTAQIKAVIIIPAGPETMEQWGKMAAGVLGVTTETLEPARAHVLEDDIVGEPADNDAEEDEE